MLVFGKRCCAVVIESEDGNFGVPGGVYMPLVFEGRGLDGRQQVLLLVRLLAILDLFEGCHVVSVRVFIYATGRLKHDADGLVTGFVRIGHPVVVVG